MDTTTSGRGTRSIEFRKVSLVAVYVLEPRGEGLRRVHRL